MPKIELPKEYADIEDSAFPIIIGGIEYRAGQELAERYESDLMAFAQLLYDIWQQKNATMKEEQHWVLC